MKYDVWLEKYRPRKIDDIVGQEEITKRLKVYIEQNNFPNLMFSGPRGTGKTTSALVMAKEIFGDNWHGNFKELNASDSRGIDTVRNEIKEYANTKPYGQFDFKILLLDEADALTSDAQSALRRTMEKFSGSCKFILSCNYSSKIIEPIQSRCAVYRFRGISPNDMKRRLLHIANLEGLTIGTPALDAIVYISDFDMRTAINALQTASLMSKEIKVESIYKSSGMAHPQHIRDLINISLKGNFLSAINKLDILVFEEGLSGIDIVKQMFKETMILDIPDIRKIDIIEKLGECDFRIAEGSNELIQLKCLITQLIRIGK